MNTDRVRRDFDKIARLTERDDSSARRYDRFLLALVPANARRVLDIGCGLGTLTMQMARTGRDILAVDLSPEMIIRARSRLRGSHRVEFICGDFLEVDFGTSGFDCVITSAALHHMQAEAALFRMRALVGPGGRLIVHDLRASAGIMDGLRMFTILGYEAVLRLLRTGWPLPPRDIRRAWKQHGAEETYPTLEQVRALSERYLPASRVYSHWGCRYTIAWDNDPAAYEGLRLTRSHNSRAAP